MLSDKTFNNTNGVKAREGAQRLLDSKAKQKCNSEGSVEGGSMWSVGDMFIPQVPASTTLYQ